jgi:D-alanyl-D-alanine carboxypeptidase (penicillin-binding protein 5/6)
MNALAHSLGLAHTRFVEPSGVAAGNVGTAVDMTRLGAAALANPAIAAIAKLGEVNLPVAGTVVNYDYDVGHEGVVGIKTGSSTEAEGNFVFAVRRKIDGRTTTAVGAVLHQEGASELQAALNAGERLAASALADARPITILPARAAAVRISAPWSSASIVCRTTKPLSFFGLPAKAKIVTRLSPGLSASHVRAREQVGTVTATVDGSSYSSPVVAPTALPGPSLHYRLTRF